MVCMAAIVIQTTGGKSMKFGMKQVSHHEGNGSEGCCFQ